VEGTPLQNRHGVFVEFHMLVAQRQLVHTAGYTVELGGLTTQDYAYMDAIVLNSVAVLAREDVWAAHGVVASVSNWRGGKRGARPTVSAGKSGSALSNGTRSIDG
jgi:hypothetical protein